MPREQQTLRLDVLSSADEVGNILREWDAKKGDLVLHVVAADDPARGGNGAIIASVRRVVEDFLQQHPPRIGEVFITKEEDISPKGQQSVRLGESRTGDVLAVKTTREGVHFDPKALQRFADAGESNVLTHPIPKTYTWKVEGDRVHSVQEYIETARRLNTLQGQFSLEQYLIVLQQLIAGLQHLHRHGIVYFDLKQENVVLNREGNIKLPDAISTKVKGKIRDALHGYTLSPPPEATSAHLPPAEREIQEWWDAWYLQEFFDEILVLQETPDGPSLDGYHPPEFKALYRFIHGLRSQRPPLRPTMGEIESFLEQFLSEIRTSPRKGELEECFRLNNLRRRLPKERPWEADPSVLQEALRTAESVEGELRQRGESDPRLALLCASLHLWTTKTSKRGERGETEYLHAVEAVAWADPLRGEQYAADLCLYHRSQGNPEEEARWLQTHQALQTPFDRNNLLLRSCTIGERAALGNAKECIGHNSHILERNEIIDLLRQECPDALTFWNGLAKEGKLSAEQLRIALQLQKVIFNAFMKREQQSEEQWDDEYLRELSAVARLILALIPQDSLSPAFLIHLGKMVEAQGNIKGAEEAFDRALSRAPPYDPAIVECIDFQRRQGNWEKVARMIEAIPPLERTPELLLMFAECPPEMRRETETTREILKQAHLRDATDGEVFVRLIEGACADGDLETIAEYCQRLLCTEPDTGSDLLRRGITSLFTNGRLGGRDLPHLQAIHRIWSMEGYSHPDTPFITMLPIAQHFGSTSFLEQIQREERQRHDEKQMTHLREQQRLYVPVPPQGLLHLEVGCMCEPAEDVAGDGVEIVSFPDGRLGVVVFDVSGHGIEAFLYMIQCKLAIREHAQAMLEDMGTFMHRLNHALHSVQQEKFVSMVCVMFNPHAGTATVFNAGHHQSPLIQRGDEFIPAIPNKEGTIIGDSSGPLLGIMPDYEGTAVTVPLQEGDRWTIMTDGAFEPPRKDTGRPVGRDHILHILRRVRRDNTPARNVPSEALKLLKQEDDVTLVTIDFT